MKHSLICLLLLSVFSTPQFAQNPPPPPPPVPSESSSAAQREKVADYLRSQDPNAVELGVVNERFHVKYLVEADGRYERTQTIRRRFETDYASGKLRDWNAFFNSILTSVEVRDAIIERADGKREPFPDGMVSIQKTAQSEAAPEFSSVSELKIDFSGMKKREVVEFTIVTITKKPLFEGVFDALEFFSPFDSYESAFVEIGSPESMPLFASTKGFEQAVEVSRNAGRIIRRWDLSDKEARRLEIGMPDLSSLAPMLIVTSMQDSKEFGGIYTNEIPIRGMVTPQIQELGDSITASASDRREKAELIYAWVNKNIRYLLVFLDRGGWIPRASDVILKNKFGDCKDYTVLMQALLKSQGIDSEPVVLRVDGSDWFPEVSSFAFFNHMILYIPELNEFADATTPDTKLGDVSEVIQGKFAVRLAGDYGSIKIPKAEKLPTFVSSKARLTYKPNGDVTMFTTISLDEKSGEPFRSMIGKPEASALGAALRLIYAGRDLTLTGNMTRLAVNAENKNVELDFAGVFDGYHDFHKKEETIELPPVNIFFEDETFKSIGKMEKRTTPILVEMLDLTEETEVDFPAGFVLNVRTPSSEFENDFGRYTRTLTVTDGRLSVSRSIRFKKPFVPVTEFSEFRKFLLSWSGDGEQEILYSLTAAFKKPGKSATKRQPVTAAAIFEELLSGAGLINPEGVTKKEAGALEKKLKANPNDKTARMNLIAFYDRDIDNASSSRKIVPHLRWLINNYPEEWSNSVILWPIGLEKDDKNYIAVRNEWIAAVAQKPDNAMFLFNAAGFIETVEPVIAENLYERGIDKFADDYRFPYGLFEFYRGVIEDEIEAPEVSADAGLMRKTFDLGELTLKIIKSNRSKEADSAFMSLLTELSGMALKMGDYSRAKELATELILIFGADTKFGDFDTATHLGNIMLGKLSLIEGDSAKAAEYLMIAIRAPLRMDESWFTPDMELAKQLFEAGNKDVVGDYLNECTKIWSLNNVDVTYSEDERDAIAKWVGELKKGETPSFDYDSP